MAMEEAQLQFGLDLVQNLYVNSTDSLLISPISIILAISLAYLGSEGDTRRQFQKRFNVNEETEHLLYDHLGDFIRRVNCYDSLSKAWVNGYLNNVNTVEPKYQQDLLEIFRTTLESLNFSQKQMCATRVNQDISSHTNGNINNVVTPEMFDPTTILMLISVIHFEAKWYNKFSSSNTQLFYKSAEKQRNVNMMYLEVSNANGCEYAENDQFKLLRLPYLRNRPFTTIGASYSHDTYFSVLLPKEKFGLKEAMKQLNATSLIKLLNNTEPRNLNIQIPSFNLEYNTDIVNVLPTIGLQQRSVNFSGITKSTPIHIESVIHKTKIEVTKSGTIASAVTISIFQLQSGLHLYNVTTFRADHPFLYLIRFLWINYPKTNVY